MSLKYKIIPDLKIAYLKATGKVTADEIITEGARMFADSEWNNGFHVLLDYRGITDLIAKTSDIEKIVHQDKRNEHLFNKSKCAIVAGSDFVFGLSRMWEALSGNTKITTMVFRSIEDSLKWFGLDEFDLEPYNG